MEWYSDGTFCEGGDIFVWQINYSNAPQVLNPDWYNPFGTTQEYPDVNPWDNILPIDGLCPCDTVYIYETDTIISYDTIIEYVDVEWIVTDTVYITEVDTLIEYVQLPPDTVLEYIQLPADTVTIYEFIYIDCSEPCSEATIFVPNTVTPNGDGYNDVWGIVYLPECFSDVEVQVYNRWGELIWEGYGMEHWDADVPDGVYVYRISISGAEELVGHITVFH
jgi:gliding motility-associated-like protein